MPFKFTLESLWETHGPFHPAGQIPENKGAHKSYCGPIFQARDKNILFKKFSDQANDSSQNTPNHRSDQTKIGHDQEKKQAFRYIFRGITENNHEKQNHKEGG